MPRAERKGSKSGVYHVMIRGINKQCIFHDDEDYLTFLDRLIRYKKDGDFELYAYCLMNNHVHLLLREKEEAISSLMKKITVSFVYWYNNKYERTGHLFQDRFRSEPIESDAHLLTVARYIHQNPVKIGRSINNWTSYPDYFKNDGAVDTDFLLNYFSTDRNEALRQFSLFMNEKNSDSYIDVNDRKRLTDTEVEIIIKKIGNIILCQDIHLLDKKERDNLLQNIKKEGASVRQIARLTGLNRAVVLNA